MRSQFTLILLTVATIACNRREDEPEAAPRSCLQIATEIQSRVRRAPLTRRPVATYHAALEDERLFRAHCGKKPDGISAGVDAAVESIEASLRACSAPIVSDAERALKNEDILLAYAAYRKAMVVDPKNDAARNYYEAFLRLFPLQGPAYTAVQRGSEWTLYRRPFQDYETDISAENTGRHLVLDECDSALFGHPVQ